MSENRSYRIRNRIRRRAQEAVEKQVIKANWHVDGAGWGRDMRQHFATLDQIADDLAADRSPAKGVSKHHRHLHRLFASMFAEVHARRRALKTATSSEQARGSRSAKQPEPLKLAPPVPKLKCVLCDLPPLQNGRFCEQCQERLDSIARLLGDGIPRTPDQIAVLDGDWDAQSVLFDLRADDRFVEADGLWLIEKVLQPQISKVDLPRVVQIAPARPILSPRPSPEMVPDRESPGYATYNAAFMVWCRSGAEGLPPEPEEFADMGWKAPEEEAS
jgi:hypothetical protein